MQKPKKTIKKKWKEKKAIWNDITKPTKTVRTDKKIEKISLEQIQTDADWDLEAILKINELIEAVNKSRFNRDKLR